MIKLASPDIRSEDIGRAVAVLQSGQLVQGENVAAFEEALGSFTGIEHCAVVSSGTAALHLALLALGIRQGDTVIVPAFTFPATANVVENIGAQVLLCDVDPDSYVVTTDAVEEIIINNRDKHITAIMVVHEFGYPADIRAIQKIAQSNGLRLIEDAACALGTFSGGYHVGHYSDAACFSFHPRKAITTGEGGAVISNDKEIIERINVLRNHGIIVREGEMDFIDAGLNYRMTDFQAALGIGQIERFSPEVERRRYLAGLYHEHLKHQKSVRLPRLVDGHAWQSFMVVLEETVLRDLVIEKLFNAGIQTNIGAQALNCLSYYARKYGVNANSCPVASNLYKHGLVLPLYGKLRNDDIEIICGKICSIIGE
ncbi:MAG: DegT/DnrJ/EryC1/StrS aminotransferase family protein [Nitrospirae bacterium]|nr:DegT/DnrJ/EryC1/StrS aminotransferase family protein [Nitrospirota bacterium]